jgi:SSS family solute:Na+ symporter
MVSGHVARGFPESDDRCTPAAPFRRRVGEHLHERVPRQNRANRRALGAQADPPVDPTTLFAANQALLAQAAAAGLPLGTKLIGYDYDAAFPTLLRNLLQPGIAWFVLAAIFGAVVSSLASMLNSASTIATIDIVAKLGHRLSGRALSDRALIASGRAFVVLFILIACVIAPGLGDPKFGGIFTFIQEFQGFISPGILCVYLFGFLVPRTPRYMGWVGILLNIVLYGALKWFLAPEMPFLNRIAVCFGAVAAAMALVTLLKPMAQPAVLPTTDVIALESSRGAKVAGVAVVVATLLLYLIFW